jgi:hypothetical protein
MLDFVAALRGIQTADSPEGVVDMVRQYLRSLSDEEVADLPFGLSADLVQRASDIALWTIQVRNAGDSSRPSAAYGRVAKLLGEASLRIAELGFSLH